jgi:dolichyl-phosphate beta-glucosyltransferase
MNTPQWSVVIPAFNEAGRLPETLRVLAETFPQFGSFEVIVVDDGSTDATSDRARQAAEELKLTHRIIRLARNQGKGAAVRAGLQDARSPWILIADADNAIPFSNLQNFLPFMASYPIIIASKYSTGEHHKNLSRTLLAQGGNWLVRILFSLPFSDTQAGFKVIKTSLAHILSAEMRTNRWAYDIELLALATAHGYPVKEVGVAWDHSTQNSRVSVTSAGISSLKEIFRIKWRLISGAYKITTPSPAGR